jgi:hypothetical protein
MTKTLAILFLLLALCIVGLLRGQDIMPPAITVDPLDMGAVQLLNNPQQLPVTVELRWTNPAFQNPAVSNLIGCSFDAVTWQPLDMLPNQRNGDVLITSSNLMTVYRVGNIL